jgi:hypothetical protein
MGGVSRSQTIREEFATGRVCIGKNRLSLSIKQKVRFAMDKGELLLLRKTRLDAALRADTIYDCLDDV